MNANRHSKQISRWKRIWKPQPVKNNFIHETNWVAITGAPSSGKTSVIEELARRGFATQGEVARELIEALLKDGKTISEIRQNPENAKELQRRIIDLKFTREKALDPERTVFMDRGMADSVTYFRIAGLDTQEAERMSRIFHYRAVFLFDRLPLVKDSARIESEIEAVRIDKMLAEDYKALGYELIRVPVMPVMARADFILRNLNIKQDVSSY